MNVNYRVEGMDCANCALTLERSLSRVPGVEKVQVNFTAATLEAAGNFDLDELSRRVEELGYRLLPAGQSAKPATAMPPQSLPAGFEFVRFLLSQRQTTLTVISAFILLVSVLFALIPASLGRRELQTAAHLSVIVLSGFPIARQGFKALWFGRQITIDLLMSIATVGALLIGESGEAATVILLFALGEALEGYSAERARRSLQSLMALKPETATVLRPCMDCVEHLGQGDYTGGPCPYCGVHYARERVEEIQVGELILVRPGEQIPMDGRIRNGVSTVNQASITGESLPVTRQAGDEVFAGTLNGEGALEIEVSRAAQDSTLSRIVRLVEQAQAQRAPVERFIDRFAAWYTPLVVSGAVLLALIPPLFFGQPFFDLPDGTRGWLYRALALLIVACPCALVISTPVTIVSALTALARRGVLVKGGVFLDLMARIRVFMLDKTGTLTVGHPRVLETYTTACEPDPAACSACEEMLLLAAAVETRSGHPLAQAVLSEVQARRLSDRIPASTSVASLPGRAVRGEVNGLTVTVGSHSYSHENFQEHPTLHDRIAQAEAQGQTVLLVSQNGEVIGFIGVADVLRDASRQALRELKQINPRFRIVMLTGDHPQAARRIALGAPELDEIHASLMPEDKVRVVQDLQAKYGPAAMVGDGVNDAPALASASLGIAMGGAGTAQAMETADIVLMQDDLTRLPDLVRTSQRSQRIIWQNILFSLGVKLAFMALALPGWTTLWMAVFADMGASLLVTLNGMRLLAEKRK